MAIGDTHVSLRVTVLAAVAAIALGTAGCGDSDDDRGGGDGGAAAAQPTDGAGGSGGSETPAATGASEAEQIESTVVRVQKAIFSGDSEFICSNITDEARKEAAKRSRLTQGPGTCEENFSRIGANRVKGSKLPAVVAVKVHGEKATVTFREPVSKFEFELPVLREDGAWKLDLVQPAVNAGAKPAGS